MPIFSSGVVYSLPSSNGWAYGGHQLLPWDILVLLYNWPVPDLGCVVTMGRVLVQYKLPRVYECRSFWSGVWEAPSCHLSRFLPSETKVEAVRRDLLDRDQYLRQLKNQADAYRQEHQFEVGEWVFWKLCPHVHHYVATQTWPKLSPRYYGPFQVVERIGAVVYKLLLPESSRIHPEDK